MADDAAPPPFDAARLIADLRKGDPAAISQAYKRTFGDEMGRLVLGHFMSECGVGAVFNAHATDAELRYQVGQYNAALTLAQMAGYDQSSAISEVFTGELEGNTDDEVFNHAADGEDFTGEY